MIRRRKPNIIIRIIYNPKMLTIFGLIIILLISYPIAKNISKHYEISQEVKELEKEISQLKDKNSNLKSVLDYMGTDQFVQEQARLNLNYNVVVIKDKNETDTANSISDNNVDNQNEISYNKIIGNPLKWWHYFFN